MSRDQKAERSHNIKVDNSSFDRVEEFKYLGTTLMDQDSIQAETYGAETWTLTAAKRMP